MLQRFDIFVEKGGRMMASDALIEQYRTFLAASYDCTDRIVVSAYHGLSQSGGGFRVWWRKLFGDDLKLDNNHLMRFASHCGRRVQAWAEAHAIPIIRCETRQRKDEAVEPLLPADPRFEGVFCVVIGRASAKVLRARRYGKKGLDIQPAKHHPHVNYYHFHIMDRQWGHIIVRLCPHPPFGAMIILNGHEWVERQARTAGIVFTKQDNCFTWMEGAADLEHHADTMKAEGFEGRVVQVCERWIYSACLGFALTTVEQKRSLFRYSYSVHQLELSRNLLFIRGRVMDQVFDSLIDRTRAPLDIQTISKIFGYQRRPYKRANGKTLRLKCTIEKPEYDLTVFKIRFGRLAVKIYSKGERVLRIEVVAHNTTDLRCGRSIEKWPRIMDAMDRILDRFTEVLNGVDAALIDQGALEALPQPSRFGAARVGGVDINRPRLRALMESIIALNLDPRGFALGDLAARTGRTLEKAAAPYGKSQTAYDLRKFRAKGLVEKVAGTRRYQATKQGLRTMAGLLTLRDKVISPLLAATTQGAKIIETPVKESLDAHYRKLQLDMLALFEDLGVAV